MKKVRFNQCVAWILVVVMCFAMSGCGMLGGGAGKEISETVEAFLDDVTSGQYAEDGFSSKYAEDDAFASLEIEDERIELFITEGLTLIRYEIEEAKGKKSDGTGECTVLMEVVDIATIFEEVEDEGYDDAALLEAMAARRAPTIEIEVVFDLEYSSRRDEWIISDSSEFAEEFSEPYLKLEIPGAQGPKATFELFASAINNGEIEMINQYFPGFWHSLYIYDDIEERMLLAFFEASTFDVLDVNLEGDSATLSVHYEHPNLWIASEIFGDRQIIETIIREYLIAEYNGEYFTDDDIFLRYVSVFEDRLESRTVQMLSSEAIVKMSFENDVWIINEFSDLEYFADSLLYLDIDGPLDIFDFDSIARDVVMDLIDEGLVDEEFFAYLLNGQINGLEVTAELLLEDLFDTYWVEFGDYDERVYYYDANTTHLIEHVVEFSSVWEGVDVVILWYFDVGDELIYLDEIEFTLEGGNTIFSFWYGYQDGDAYLPSGTYYVIWELPNGEGIFLRCDGYLLIKRMKVIIVKVVTSY